MPPPLQITRLLFLLVMITTAEAVSTHGQWPQTQPLDQVFMTHWATHGRTSLQTNNNPPIKARRAASFPLAINLCSSHPRSGQGQRSSAHLTLTYWQMMDRNRSAQTAAAQTNQMWFTSCHSQSLLLLLRLEFLPLQRHLRERKQCVSVSLRFFDVEIF